MLLPYLMSSIRTLCYIYMPWHHSSSPFSQSLGLWHHIMWHVMWPQSHTSFFILFYNQQFITRGVRVDCGNYLVATVHWWADNMKMKKKRKRKGNLATLTGLLHYYTLLSKRVSVVFYCANPYWNSYANKDNYSCLLDGLLCNLRT